MQVSPVLAVPGAKAPRKACTILGSSINRRLGSVFMIGIGIYAQSRLEETKPQERERGTTPPRLPIAALLRDH